MAQPTLLIIESRKVIRDVLAASAVGDLFSVSWLREPAPATELAKQRPPQLILAGVPALDASGIATIAALALRWPDVPLLAVTETAADGEVVAALRAGASGCLFREDLARRLVPAIHEALDGGAPMSRAVARLVLERARRKSSTKMPAVVVDAAPQPPVGERKREILEMMGRGLSYEQMAIALGISVNTVRSHVRELYELLQVSTKVEAVLAAVERGILKRR
jgi:DNA-binding NarL/FixJ family response regulator